MFGVYWHDWKLQYAVFTAVAMNSLLANLGLLQLLINDLALEHDDRAADQCGLCGVIELCGASTIFVWSSAIGSIARPLKNSFSIVDVPPVV